MKLVLCMVGLTALAVTLTSAQTTEEVLTRCTRPGGGLLCMMFCENGHKTDVHGCPQCDCLEDPCQNEDTCATEEGMGMCQSTPTCTTDPCTSMDHKCVAMPACPMPQCGQACPNGYKTDSNGCMSCQCKEHVCEEHECAKDHSCIPSDSAMPFFHEYLNKICLPDVHKPEFINQFPAHPMDLDLDELPPLCSFKEMLMDGIKHQVKENTPDAPPSVLDRLAHSVNCNEDGTYKPVQCNHPLNVCWCVNDLGIELRGSRVHLKEGEQEPQCEQYKTIKVDITMVITHNFDDVSEHMDKIKDNLVDQLSLWLQIDGQYIEINAILPHKDQVNLIKVDITLTQDGETDLAFVAERFKFDAKKTPHVIECHGQQLQVDGQSVTLKHTSKPLTQIDHEEEDPEPYYVRCGRVWREHKAVVFVAGFGVLVFFMVIMGICIVACKKKRSARAQFNHKKMNTYSENLAYQNDVYGHPELAEEKDVKVLGMEFGNDGKPTAKY